MGAVLGSGGGPLKTASVSLSSAQILALNTSPVTIVPAQTGLAIWPISAALLYKAGATPYNQQTGVERILWSGQNALGDGVFAGLAGPGNAIVFFNLAGHFEGFDVVTNFGAVTIDNSVANPTDGDGTAVVTVWYMLVSKT